MTCIAPTRRLTSTAVLAVFSFAATTSLVGCGGGGGEDGGAPHTSAYGKVEFEGEPVAAGTVTFTHTETGYHAICNIYDGEYESESSSGPNPGPNVVLITAKESEEGNPIWQQPWKKDVQVSGEEFTEDFSITKADVIPFDPASIQIDED